jgi:hypothetical protein
MWRSVLQPRMALGPAPPPQTAGDARTVCLWRHFRLRVPGTWRERRQLGWTTPRAGAGRPQTLGVVHSADANWLMKGSRGGLLWWRWWTAELQLHRHSIDHTQVASTVTERGQLNSSWGPAPKVGGGGMSIVHSSQSLLIPQGILLPVTTGFCTNFITYRV